MTRYWIGVASREHVQRGITEGICQVCHGKAGPLKFMSPGDWIIYYSPTIKFIPGKFISGVAQDQSLDIVSDQFQDQAQAKTSAQIRLENSCKKFTAIGKIKSQVPYQFQMAPDFIPWRHDVEFLPATEVAIAPLIAKLSFIINKQSWGFPFRRGCFEISAADFNLIANSMGISFNS